VPKTLAPATWQRAVVVLAGTAVATAVIAGLYWAQAVLIPVALAVFLTFVLAPAVTALQRRWLGRTPAVILVVLAAALAVGGAAWLVTSQVAGLLRELPTHTENITKKTRALRDLGRDSLTGGLDKMFHEVSGAWHGKPAEERTTPAQPVGQADQTGPAPPDGPPAAAAAPESPPWLGRLSGMVQPVAELLGMLALALVLTVFMLLKREDLRNRLIRLIGHGSLTATTRAVDEAGQRISRYLLMQALLNGGCGVIFGVALLVIGVPYAPLWGLVLALLRYVPYIGSWVALLMPLGLSLAVAPGWGPPLAVLACFTVLELTAANVVEPRVFGHSIGVSEVALLISAALWAFLWGPIGLVLSGPLTVCLVVLGRYVPRLAFLDVLLGDQPALAAHISYYQRLLARDPDEAEKLVRERAKVAPPEEVFDALLVPALTLMKGDLERGDLSEADEEFVIRATREIIADLGDRQAAAAPSRLPPDHPVTKARLLACAAGADADLLGGEMLTALLDPSKWDVEILGPDSLTSEVLAEAAENTSAVICVGSLPPGGLAHTRYLCKRLRARFPGVKIVVGRWGLQGDVEENREPLLEAGADLVVTTLAETRDQLRTWLPVLGGAPSSAGAGAGAQRQATPV
jgi:predicted PurR-regulated permease PerM/methylmalonyl-CoA mutase cobalamin-binding subunit